MKFNVGEIDGGMGGETGGANGSWMRKVEEEVGNEQGEAKGEEGKEAVLSTGSGVQEGHIHLWEGPVVVVKISQNCHHLLTTDVTGFARGLIKTCPGPGRAHSTSLLLFLLSSSSFQHIPATFQIQPPALSDGPPPPSRRDGLKDTVCFPDAGRSSFSS